MTEQVVNGYGESDCATCKIILDPEMAELCWLMVSYTNLQIAAAKSGNWAAAIVYEGLQNKIALDSLKGRCAPGAAKV